MNWQSYMFGVLTGIVGTFVSLLIAAWALGIQ